MLVKIDRDKTVEKRDREVKKRQGIALRNDE